jgi:citronellol/citronellal dehydrogenase
MPRPTEHQTFGLKESDLEAAPMVYRDDLLAGQVALVSGAGSGIGKGIAYVLARLGADLVVCGRDEAKLSAAADFLRRTGRNVEARAMTIREPEEVDALIDAAWDRFGRLDLLVNNAGGQFPSHAIDIPPKGWRAVIDTNLNGSWFMMQAAAKRWRKHKHPGSIVNIIADFWRGIPHLAHTSAARAGVSYLARTLAVEWAPLNIRVNCVAPGVIETEGLNVYPKELAERIRYTNPMMRLGSVMDVAEAVVYIGGPPGRYITGETLTVDGGQQLWGQGWALGKPEYYNVPV